VLAEAGTDTLRFGGTGTGTFDFGSVGAAAQYRDFETFEVTGGTWQFTGTLASPISVTGPGVLAGTATVGALTVNAGGTVAPGNPVGSIVTLTSTGPVTFAANSTFQVNVDAAGQADMLQVNGGGLLTISTTGTVLDIQALPGSYNPGQTFRIARTLNLSGRFATVQDSLPDVDFQPSYADDGITLGLIASNGTQSPKGVLPSSLMAAVHNDRLFNQTLRRRGGLMVSGLGNQAVRGTFGSAVLGFYPGQAPEHLPQHALAADLPAQPSARFGMPAAEPVIAPDWAVWGAVMGRSAHTDGAGALSGWDAQIGGMAVGVERQLAFNAGTGVAGLAGGFTRSQMDAQGSGGDIDGYHVGAYAASDLGALSLSGALSYAWQNYDLDRRIPVGVGFVTARGSSGGHSLTASAEAFYDMTEGFGQGSPDDGPWGNVAIGPLVTLESVWADRDGFTETGAGVLNLTVAGQSMQQTVTGLGLAAQSEHRFGEAEVRFEGRVSWEHVFGNRDVVTSSAIPSVAATFLTASAPISRDRVAVGLGSVVTVSDSLSLHLRYDGSFSDSTHDHQGSAGLAVSF
jgi:subtilase-type serine protease